MHLLAGWERITMLVIMLLFAFDHVCGQKTVPACLKFCAARCYHIGGRLLQQLAPDKRLVFADLGCDRIFCY